MFNWGWLLQLCGFLVLLGGALAVIVKGVRWMASLARMLREFLEDWRGEEARPGYAKRPGVMERLVSLENTQAELKHDLAEVRHEVKPNSGTSLKDQITRIETTVVPAEERVSS